MPNRCIFFCRNMDIFDNSASKSTNNKTEQQKYGHQKYTKIIVRIQIKQVMENFFIHLAYSN